MADLSTRDIFIRTAASLFRKKGYSGVGLREILAATNLPKGSLYYHFPGGKRELAMAATRWTDTVITRLVDKCFTDADTFRQGAAVTCHAVAKISETNGVFEGCPVVSILQAGVDEPELRALSQSIFAGWIDLVGRHAQRFECANPPQTATLFVMQLQGAWLLAVAGQSPAPFDLLERSLVE